MAKFNLNLRNPNATDETPIHLVVRWNNSQRVVIKTGRTANPKYWNKETQRLDTKRNTPKYLGNEQVNAFLEGRVADAKELFVKFSTINDREPTAGEFLELLNTKFGYKSEDKPIKTGLFDFIETRLSEIENGVNPVSGKPYSPDTPRAYKQCLTQLLEYSKKTKKRIDFDTIDLRFHADFFDYLINKKGYRLNSAGKLIKTLKTFLNEAVERNLTTNMVHKGRRFIAPREKVSKIYLTLEELKALYNLNLSKEKRLEKVRDLFLFGCFTGLRFSDFSKIKPENIDFSAGVIDLKTQKTDDFVSVPILPITAAIIKKYNGKSANSLPDSISNQKFNEYLKEIAKQLPELQTIITDEHFVNGKKITRTFQKWEKVTTHTARRSFATNMILEGYPSQMIMKITGHKTESAFQTYLKMSPRESAKMLMREWESRIAINQK